MGISWTDEQQQVIDLRDRNILVAAAAGSGKTAVLVERILARLLDEEHPVDIDRLLITTFTNAAAAEMKERIGNMLEERLKDYPGSAHLQRQLTLLHNAQITTIHGFCLNLIRNHFNSIDLDPGFRIGDEGELKLLRHDTLEQMLEECYASEDEEFCHFVECYAEGKNDSRLEEYIMQVYDFSRSHPDPERWLQSCISRYEVGTTADLETSSWMKEIMQQVHTYAADYIGLIEYAITITQQDDGPYMYEAALQADLDILEAFVKADSYEACLRAAGQIKWQALGRKKDDAVLLEKREQVKAIRDRVKDGMGNLCKQYFFQDLDGMLADMKASGRVVKELVRLVLLFDQQYQAAKAVKNIIDFNDLEHFALRILKREENGRMVRTEIAEEYSRHFEELLIDEYQDINLIQEEILTSVSREHRGENNVFRVGDVKQSIYKFRLSRPELFLEKYNTYTQDASPSQRIDLHSNFRSRAEVLDSVNYICYQIMTKKLGNIEYDEAAALHPGATFPESKEAAPGKTELHILDVDKELLKEQKADITERELEAKLAARRIKEMKAHSYVFDKETQTYRQAGYGDMVILLRSLAGWADVYARVLQEEGIPAFTTSKTGYFSAIEVQTVLNLLRVLDNPRQDIPLAAVLHSPIGRLTNREMALIRQEVKEGRFYECVASYREQGTDAKLRQKLEQFYEMLLELRAKVPHTPVHEMLQLALERTGYGVYVSAMPGGGQRKANLDMLMEKAVDYGAGSYKGLFHFVRYIEQLQKYDVDFGEAGTTGEDHNTVRIMSIHKSKGLEFPIVFVGGMGKGFNTQDSRSRIMVHQELGLGVDFVDPEVRIKAPSLLKKAIQKQISLENLGEELRVLYVALTRAKEKLVMIGTVPDFASGLQQQLAVTPDGEQLSFQQLAGAKSYMDWLIPALFRETRADLFELSVATTQDLLTDTVEEKVQQQRCREEFLNWDPQQVYDAKAREAIRTRMEYVYPYESEAAIRTKVTVSELKKMGQYENEELLELQSQQPDIVPLLPQFISGEDTAAATGATRGTAYHRVLELIPLSGGTSYAFVEAAMEQMIAAGKLTREAAALVYKKHVVNFLQSDLARRMTRAEQQGQLWRERSFVIGTEASAISDQFKSEELVLVQGIIDAYFEEDGELVLVDFKSDQVKTTEELIRRYQVQLDSYQKALEQLTGKKVKEKLIYSFSLDGVAECK